MNSTGDQSGPSLSAAVIGTGFIGPVHVEALRRAGIPVQGILGSNEEKSKTAATELGIPKGYRSLVELLEDDSVSVVHVTTPNQFHFEQVSALVSAGKHVLCEKPLAMNSDQTTALMRLANENNVVAGVAYNIRFYPLCHHAADLAKSNRLGQVLHVHGSYTQDWLLKPTDFNWRVVSSEGGELRTVADIGTHWLDLIQFIVGEKVTSVFADLRTVYPHRFPAEGSIETFSGKTAGADVEPASASSSVEIDTEDCGSVLLRFAGGANGCLWVSQTTAGRKNCLRYEIAGTEQSLAWNSELPNNLRVGHRDLPNENLIRDPALMSSKAATIANYPGGHNEGFPDTFKQLFKTFYSYIAAGDFQAQRPFPTFEDGHYEVLICEAILKSHREQRWIEVGESECN